MPLFRRLPNLKQREKLSFGENNEQKFEVKRRLESNQTRKGGDDDNNKTHSSIIFNLTLVIPLQLEVVFILHIADSRIMGNLIRLSFKLRRSSFHYTAQSEAKRNYRGNIKHGRETENLEKISPP